MNTLRKIKPKSPPKTLDPSELAQAQSCIYFMAPGNYEAKKILGEHWKTIAPVFSYGARFRVAVNRRLLKNIRCHSKNRGNSLVYTVFR